MTTTKTKISCADMIISDRVVETRRINGGSVDTCPTCGNHASLPFRSLDAKGFV